MPKRSTKKRKKKKDHRKYLKYFLKALWFIIKIPYYLTKGIIFLVKKTKKKSEEVKVQKKRRSMKSEYKAFKVLDSLEGDYKKWEGKIIKSDSQIGIILGARGAGKTAIGIKFIENVYAKSKTKCFAIGFNEDELPSWIKGVSETSEIENDSWVLIDEGGVLFNSRSSMSNANKMLSQLMLIARHKNISILFISQNSSNLEVNILRQADFLALKRSSLLQKDFERKIIQKIYSETKNDFKKHSDDKGLTLIYADEFRGFVSNDLPSFWKEEISKSFKKK